MRGPWRARAEAQPEQVAPPNSPILGTQARDTLPAQPTPFIGREGEIAALRDLLLDPETRLLTLTGPGGMGKTRLALQVAAAVRDRFLGGVIFVDLGTIADPDLLLPTIAQALEVTEVPGQTIGETLAAALGGKRRLLVLDNFEQILPAAMGVADLLAAVPDLTVLVTSRAALRLRGERLRQVVPLEVPMPPLPSLDALSQYEAVRLFIARARDVLPGFAVTNETAPAVAGICARLDGLPLAIELAAARTRILPPKALLARLGERLRVATGGARDLPDRQRTLRAAIDWSYELLDPAEQTLFGRLAAFSGGGTLAAVEAVCDVERDLGIEVVDGIESPLDKSLLRKDESPEGEHRLVMLETIHEYARERLVASTEQAALRQAHARYYLTLAEEAEPELTGPQQVEWLTCLEAEHDNLRAVLRWSLGGTGESAVGLALAGVLWRFWSTRGHFSEGLAWLDEVLGHDSGTNTVGRVRALTAAGNFARWLGDNIRAAALQEESLALAQELGDRPGIAAALRNLGGLVAGQGDYVRAATLIEESLALYRDLADKQGIAAALLNLSFIAADQGDYARAAAFDEESLALVQELKDRGGIARALRNLGVLAADQGDYARAAAFYEEGLALGRELGNRRYISWTLLNLGAMASSKDDHARAVAYLDECLMLFRALGDKRGIAEVLRNLGNVAFHQSHYNRAAALLVWISHGDGNRLDLRSTPAEMGDKRTSTPATFI